MSRFFGVIECGPSSRSFNMTLRGGNRSNFPGEVALRDDGPAAPGGMYRVKASIDDRGRLVVTPLGWIGKPASKPMLGFTGMAHPNGAVVAGQSTTPGCGKLSLVLDSDDGFWPILSAHYSIVGHAAATTPVELPLNRTTAPRQPLAASRAQPTRPAARPAGQTRRPDPRAPRGFLPPHVVAKGNPSYWVNSVDYPSRAANAQLTGDHYITLTVGSDGRVASCQTSLVTGEASLADNSCNIAQRRARFGLKPGVTSGTISGTYVLYVRYFCEDECRIGTRLEN